MRRSWWRLVAVLFLVPVVVFSNAETASATTAGTANFAFGGAFNTAECQIPWGVNAGGLVIGSTARCDAGPDVTPYSCQAFEGDCGSYGLVLKDSGGATLGSTGFEDYSCPPDGVTSTASCLGGGYLPVVWDTVVSTVDLCLSYYLNMPLGVTDTVQCVTIDVTPPDTAAVSCPYGAPTGVSERIETVNNGTLSQRQHYVTVAGATPWAVSNGTGWNFSVLLGEADVEGVQYSTVASSTGEKMVRAVNFITGDPGPEFPPIAGVEVWYADPAFPQSGNPGSVYAAYRPPDGYMGQTDPSLCRFWFGPKIYDDPSTQRDEPYGTPGVPIVVPPTDPPVVVVPDDDTPTTDSGLWAAILGVLRAIAAGISNLISAVGRIAGAFLDGLSALFVPTTDSWNVAGIQDQLAAKPPFSVGAELKDQAVAFGGAYQASGSCGVVATFGEGMSLDCEQIRNSPGLGGLYTLVAAGLISLTAWGGFNMISDVFKDGS